MLRGSLLLASLVLLAACGRADDPASTATASPRVMTEAQAWAEVRSSLPAVPIILPTWLPPSLDPTRAELKELVRDPADPRYAIAYVAPSGATILIALGPASDIAGSGIGTRVRNSRAALTFPTTLWSDPSKPALRRVRWQEDRYVLRIESERFTGEDLLHVAWSLDRTGAPAPKTPYTRTKPGACAARGAAPTETVQRLLAFVGGRDRDAVMDCFSLELLGDYPGYGGWAELPRASDIKLQPPSELGGRIVVAANWMFASDPGGAWGQQAFQVFVLGLEEGSWRVYETGTAMYGPPP